MSNLVFWNKKTKSTKNSKSDSSSSRTSPKNWENSSSPHIPQTPSTPQSYNNNNNNNNHNITSQNTSGKKGWKNLGNTCYLNSAIQCLSHLPDFISYLSSTEFNIDIEKNKSLYYKDTNINDVNDTTKIPSPELQDNSGLDIYYNIAWTFKKLVNNLWSNSSLQVINPKEFRDAWIILYPEYSLKEQQDAHEVWTYILDALSTAINRVKNNGISICKEISDFSASGLRKSISKVFNDSHKAFNDSYIIDNFFGQMKLRNQCITCNKIINESYEPFSSLELPLPHEYKIYWYWIPNKFSIRPYCLYVQINDNLQFKDIIGKVRKITGYHFRSGTFYWVNDNKLEKIIDIEERCGYWINRENFLFLMENKPRVDEKEQTSSDSSNKEWKLRFYFSLNFKWSVNEYSINEKAVTYPRIFPVYGDLGNLSIWKDIVEYTLGFVNGYNIIGQKGKYNSEASINCLSRYTISAIKGTDTHNSTVFKCSICDCLKYEAFECVCIQKIILDTLNERTKAIETMESITDSTVIILNFSIPFDQLIIKELNRCRDYTERWVTEKEWSITDLWNYFFAKEKIIGNYLCESCSFIKSLNRTQEINHFPNILIIHWKRFHYAIEDKSLLTNIGSKNDNVITFEEKLDLSKYNSKGFDGRFKLCSVIYHKGSISSGHYTAICKHFPSDNWYMFDDVRVIEKKVFNSKMKFDINKNDAYILLYMKCHEAE